MKDDADANDSNATRRFGAAVNGSRNNLMLTAQYVEPVLTLNLYFREHKSAVLLVVFPDSSYAPGNEKHNDFGSILCTAIYRGDDLDTIFE